MNKNCEVKTKKSGKLAMVLVTIFSAFTLMVMGIWAVANGRGVSFSLPITLDPLTFLTIQMQMDYNGDGNFNEEDGEDEIYTIFDNTASGSVSWAYVSEGAISFAKNSPIKNVSNDTIYKLIFTNKSGESTYLNIFENYDDSFYNKPFTTYPTGGILNLENEANAAMLVHSNPVLTTGLYPLPLKIEKLTAKQSNVFTLELDQTGVTSSTPTNFTISNENSFQTIFTALDNYALPSQVKITCAGTELEKDIDYKWNQETGELNIFARSITGDIEIRIIGVELNWDNEDIATSFANSTETDAGTESNPYEIQNASQLAYLGTIGGNTTGLFYELTTDINLNGSESNQWTPITSFQGTFDGGGFTIEGLYINQPTAEYQSLFGYIYKGNILNVTVKNGEVHGGRYIAGICAKLEYGVIKNCINYLDIYQENSQKFSAGICGTVGLGTSVEECYSAEVINCINYGNVCGYSQTGGIVAYAYYSGLLNGCVNHGIIHGEGASSMLGGVVGDNYGLVFNCVNLGTVKAVSGGGGIAGKNSSRFWAKIVNCYNAGTIINTDLIARTGGICYCNAPEYTEEMYMKGQITNCYNIGKFVHGTSTYIGGIIYLNAVTEGRQKIQKCYYLSENSEKGIVNNDHGGTSPITSVQALCDALNTGVDEIKSMPIIANPATDDDVAYNIFLEHVQYLKYWTLVGSETGYPVFCS